jgi:carbonic anhydrase/acetyltransferase-like protein (isoleucine patch superfamily)
VQDDCLIGIGAIVLNKCVVGRGSLVGAGAIITEGTVIPPGSLVLGVPARVVRMLSQEQQDRVARGALVYADLAERHKRGEFMRHR